LEKVACAAFSDRAAYPPAKGVALAGCRVAASASPTSQPKLFVKNETYDEEPGHGKVVFDE
jgi:hypothetical protein